MIIATPLDLPNLIVDDWDVFWKLWNKHADYFVKVRQNIATSKLKVGGESPWWGMDIYYNHIELQPAWDAPIVNIQKDLPMLYKQVSTLPFKGVYRVRLMMSISDIVPHTDDDADSWSVRYMFHYTDPYPQWFFTLPGGNEDTKQIFKLPEETNWFAYNDKYCWHGTTRNPIHPKILMQVFIPLTYGKKHLPLVQSSIEKYKDFTVSI